MWDFSGESWKDCIMYGGNGNDEFTLDPYVAFRTVNNSLVKDFKKNNDSDKVVIERYDEETWGVTNIEAVKDGFNGKTVPAVKVTCGICNDADGKENVYGKAMNRTIYLDNSSEYDFGKVKEWVDVVNAKEKYTDPITQIEYTGDKLEKLKKYNSIQIKKIFVMIALLIAGLTTIYFTIFLIQNISLVKSYSIENDVELNTEDTKFIRCNYNILKPEFAYTFPFSDKIHVSLLRSEKLFSQTGQEWDNNEIGGTTIENTTFDELVKMVKEDCSQFQKAKGSASDETINWSYSPYTYEPTEPKVEYTEGMIETERQRVLDQYNRVQEIKNQSN